MQVGRIRRIDGPNLHSYRPVLVMDLYLRELDQRDSHTLPGFVDRLLSWLPELHDHGCAAGTAGAFVERLRTGTHPGHIIEHVALELSHHAGCGVNFGRTRRGPDSRDHYFVVVEFTNAAAMELLLRASVDLVQAAVDDRLVDIPRIVEKARTLVARTGLGPSTRAIVEAANTRGIPVQRLNEHSLLQLGYGRHRKHVQAAMTEATSAVGVQIASDKVLTKSILDAAYIPTPAGAAVETRKGSPFSRPRTARSSSSRSMRSRAAECRSAYVTRPGSAARSRRHGSSPRASSSRS